MNSVELLSKGQYDDIRSMIDQALKAGQSRDLGHEYEKDLESRYRLEERGAVPTLWPHINDLLMGGLGAGDLGMVLGSPGGGKSWFLINLGATAVKMGYTVCHYTLELSQEYVGKRYDSILTGIDFQNIHKEESRKLIEETISSLPGKLIIKEYPMGKTTPSSIETHIQKCVTLGHKPDLVVIDYVDLLRSKSKSSERKDQIDDVYTSIKGLARQIRTPIWTVSQVNRCHNVDDQVDTPSGKQRIGDLKVGDMVLTHKGFRSVTRVFPVERQPTYKIKLKNGKEINVSANHILPTQYKQLKSIATGLKVGDKLFVKK